MRRPPARVGEYTHSLHAAELLGLGDVVGREGLQFVLAFELVDVVWT
jgi:hypothetical protein